MNTSARQSNEIRSLADEEIELVSGGRNIQVDLGFGVKFWMRDNCGGFSVSYSDGGGFGVGGCRPL